MTLLAPALDQFLDLPARLPQDMEERYLRAGVSWPTYEAFLTARGDRAGTRVSYLDGVLEIMAPSRRHEEGKTQIGTLLEIYFVAADIEYFPMGSTTLRQAAQAAGIEPDESYCLRADKEVPDLAIEVIVTSGGLDRLAIYQRLGVQEVWFWQREQLTLYSLRETPPVRFVTTHGYEAIPKSELLPELDIAWLAECVRQPSPLAAARAFRSRLP